MAGDRPQEGSAVMLGALMSRGGGRSNNFDVIRLGAAVVVVLSHAFMVVSGSEASEPLYLFTHGQMTLGVLGVTVFFFVSGLLITSSYNLNPNAASFTRKRALRLIPALLVLCLLTVLVLGPLVTDRSLKDYFAAPETWSYLANAVLILPARYHLPGVFENEPMARLVNGSLWTLWYEVACYAVVVGLGALRLLRWQVVLSLWVASVLWPLLGGGHEAHTGVLYRLTQLAELFRYFGAGMLVFLLRDHIRVSWLQPSAAVGLLGLSAMTPWFQLTLALALPVLVVWAAYHAYRPGEALLRHGDLSYGVYLYAFPIQQLVMQMMPGQWPWWHNFAVSLPLTVACALLSWRFVEQPALRLKSWPGLRFGRALATPR